MLSSLRRSVPASQIVHFEMLEEYRSPHRLPPLWLETLSLRESSACMDDFPLDVRQTCCLSWMAEDSMLDPQATADASLETCDSSLLGHVICSPVSLVRSLPNLSPGRHIYDVIILYLLCFSQGKDGEKIGYAQVMKSFSWVQTFRGRPAQMSQRSSGRLH